MPNGSIHLTRDNMTTSADGFTKLIVIQSDAPSPAALVQQIVAGNVSGSYGGCTFYDADSGQTVPVRQTDYNYDFNGDSFIQGEKDQRSIVIAVSGSFDLPWPSVGAWRHCATTRQPQHR